MDALAHILTRPTRIFVDVKTEVAVGYCTIHKKVEVLASRRVEGVEAVSLVVEDLTEPVRQKVALAVVKWKEGPKIAAA